MARILVIEDNPVNLDLMTYLLQAWGHEPITATDGESGLALVRSARPDLVLCDIQMPGALDGYAVAREIRADPSLAGVPLVALTAYAMVGDSDRSIEAGFDLHIAKPVEPDRFMAVLAELLPQAGGSPAAPADTTSGAFEPETLRADLRAPRQGIVLLMVDDNPANLEFKVRLLEPAGYTVLTSANAEDALRILRSRRVDLVISDVVMGSISGLDLVGALRADPALRSIGFIFLTSSACDSASMARGLAAGADDYLMRPIEPERLLAVVRARLEAPR